MSAQGVHKITEEFEKELAKYTGAPYVLAIDNQSNALFLCLLYKKYKGHLSKGQPVSIPSHTYPSVPCEIIRAGLSVEFRPSNPNLTGMYELGETGVIDSALRFTTGMYLKGTMMCLSFTGPFKHLKLGKGGAILLDDKEAYEKIKKWRFSGRGEMSYHEDPLVDLGFNHYMMPEIAARGIQLMSQFYNPMGDPLTKEDLTLPYPNLSKKRVYTSKVHNSPHNNQYNGHLKEMNPNRKKCYISGKITGLEIDVAERYFERASQHVERKYDLQPVNPMKHVGHDHDKSWESYMKQDIKALLDCDYIFMMPNWKKSKGAIEERRIAKLMGIGIIEERIPRSILWKAHLLVILHPFFPMINRHDVFNRMFSLLFRNHSNLSDEKIIDKMCFHSKFSLDLKKNRP